MGWKSFPPPFLPYRFERVNPGVESLLLFTAPHFTSRRASPDASPFAHPSHHIRRVQSEIDAVSDSRRAPGPRPLGRRGEGGVSRLLSPRSPLLG